MCVITVLISDPSCFGLFGGRHLASALEGRRNNILILCLFLLRLSGT